LKSKIEWACCVVAIYELSLDHCPIGISMGDLVHLSPHSAAITSANRLVDGQDVACNSNKKNI